MRGGTCRRPSDRRSQFDGLDRDIASLHDCLLERPRSSENQARSGTAISNALGAIYSNRRAMICFAQMLFLPLATWIRLVAWLAVGMAIYFGYSYHHSRLNRK
jgi:hypothetical protein